MNARITILMRNFHLALLLKFECGSWQGESTTVKPSLHGLQIPMPLQLESVRTFEMIGLAGSNLLWYSLFADLVANFQNVKV